jgi:two-component system NarL family sensor kinase
MSSNVLARGVARFRAPADEIRRSIVIKSSKLIAVASALGAACLLLCYVALTSAPPAHVHFEQLATAAVAFLLLGVAAGVSLARRVGKPIETLVDDAAKTAGELKFAQARHESFWSQTPESLFTVEVTADGRFVFAGINPAHEQLTGLLASQIVGKEPRACLTPEVAQAVTGRYRECVRRAEAMTYDETLDLPGGLRFWRTSLAPVRDPATGRIALLFGSARDVTRDLQANAELTRLNERLRSILASVSDCYCTFDRACRMTAANPAALQWLGLDEETAIGRPLAEAFNPATKCGRAMRRAMDHGEPVHMELPSALRPGRWLDYHIYPSPDGISVFFRDVTEAKTARQALEEISRQLLVSQEEERQRIASELHDSTAQHLVSVNLNLMRLATASTDSERQIRAEIEHSLDEALKEIRVFTYLLHPPGLHSDGLNATLRSFVEGFAHRAGLRVALHATAALDGLSEDLQRSLFRVVQEALLNAHRHAAATRVAIGTRLVRGVLVVRIRDNGRGMPSVASAPAGPGDGARLGVGIPGMRARLRQFGGDLTIRSQSNGTTLLAMVPVPPVAAAARAT